MTYGGESWNKKGARFTMLGKAVERHARENRCRPPTCMVLSGPDAADVRFLRASGVPVLNIIAVDTDSASCDAARRVEPGCVVREMDVVDAARLHRETVDILVLDLCAQLSEQTVDLFAKVAGIACRSGAVVIAAFSYGREIGARMENVSAMRTHARTWIKDRSGIIHARLNDNAKRARLETFMLYARRSFQKRLLTWVGTHEGPVVAFYSSQKEGRGSTPMMYVSGTVVREPLRIMMQRDLAAGDMSMVVRTGGALHGPVRIDEKGLAWCAISQNGTHVGKQLVVTGGEADVRKNVVEMRKRFGWSSSKIADYLNMNPGVIAAWLAVHTRQSAAGSVSDE